MRKITLVLFLVVVSVAYSQVLSLQNTYRGNDRLEEKQIAFPHLANGDVQCVWDISRQNRADDDYIIEYCNATDTAEVIVSVTEKDTRYLYELQNDSLLLNGFENKLTRINYDMREAYLHFPMQYGDSIEGYFHGTGRYCDRMGIRNYGWYKTKADGKGDLIISEGDTLRNVLRLHTERILLTDIVSVDFLDSLVAYNTDSIVCHLTADTALVRMDIYRWYAEGYRYPILETRQRSDGNIEQPLSSLAYYCPLSEQQRLSNDPINEENRTRGIGQDGGYRTPYLANQEKPLNEEADLYTIEGFRMKANRQKRNGTYLLEQRSGDSRTVKKIIVKNN